MKKLVFIGSFLALGVGATLFAPTLDISETSVSGTSLLSSEVAQGDVIGGIRRRTGKGCICWTNGNDCMCPRDEHPPVYKQPITPILDPSPPTFPNTPILIP